MTAAENLSVACRSRGQRNVEQIERVFGLFPELATGQMRHRAAGTLSGGERQMLTLARAAILSPSVVLIDSPFLGAGPHIRQRVSLQIQRWQHQAGVSVLLVDHDIETVRHLANRVLRLSSGVLIVDDPSQSLLHRLH